MTVEIKISDLPCPVETFAEHVADYAARLNEYARHLAGVEEDKNNPDLKPEDRRVAFPAPTHHPLVMSACRQHENGEIVGDYQIVGPTLEERKATLIADLRQQAAAMIAKVMPPAKVRHWQYRAQDIHAADQMRVNNHPVKIESDQVQAWLRSVRPAEDTACLDDLNARHETTQRIERWVAKQEHDIDDLTEETIDDWVMAPFNG